MIAPFSCRLVIPPESKSDRLTDRTLITFVRIPQVNASFATKMLCERFLLFLGTVGRPFRPEARNTPRDYLTDH